MRKDQLTSYNGETIAYDAMGNPTVYRGMEMGWKNSSELTEIVKDQTTIRYRYDKEGMRNRKYLSDGTTVLYQVQDGQIIGEQHLREDQEKPLYEMTFSYDADGTLFSMKCDGKDYYYILNPTGDVIALVDTGWNTVVSYAYDSWGNVTAIEGDQDLGKKNPLRYRGYYWDAFQALVKTSRLETGVIQLDKKPGRLFDTVAQAMSGIVYAAEKKEIAVSVDCPENLTFSHDSKWTSEALFNLLDNAVKYTPAGGKIAVSVVLWEMYVEIKVVDTGKGISESNQAAIFRRFYREEEVHEQQGVGIGLYLAREIVTRQGGYIKVVSEPGKGSEFSIMLPTK